MPITPTTGDGPEARLAPSASMRGPSHGGGIRGADLSRRSPQFEGRFGRMFRTLPAAVHRESDLTRLGRAMTAEPEAEQDADGHFVIDPVSGFVDVRATPEHELDDEENFGIPAGYTYLGQFIDHDLTFDPASSLQRQNDPDGLIDYRTPRFDLDCVYGRGPDDQPFMYAPDGRHFLLGDPLTQNGVAGTEVPDLPRFAGRALIGDKRNDENVIVSQLQGAFLRFHNAVADRPELAHAGFEEVQRLVRWHYQWIVLHDFLPRIVGRDAVHAVLPHLATGNSIYDDRPRLHFYHWRNEPYIPVEFSVAAYRFGHSMVRPIYRLNPELGVGEPQTEVDAGRAGRQFIFAGVAERSLAGFGPFPNVWAIDWRLFFELDAALTPQDTLARGPRRVQPSYKIDTSLVNPLGFLPEFSQAAPGGRSLVPGRDGTPAPQAHAISNLAERNLLRGLRMGLPSGQDVARYMGLTPLADRDIRIGKANWDSAGDPHAGNRPITQYGTSFRGSAPLWTYILAEAQHDWLTRARALPTPEHDADTLPARLGPVGGRIVAEVFAGLLLGDSMSFLSQDPNWRPTLADSAGRFGMPQLFAAIA